MFRVVAIDGPAASGKSSVARALAGRLGFACINSGALYRAVTWHVLEDGVSLDNASAIAATAEARPLALDETRLREARVNAAVSRVSSVPEVREILNRQMRERAAAGDVVVEGRDIGSAVFPDTPFKFYLDASPSIRARRRAAQGEADEISARDQADASRVSAPLVIASDAVVIDTSAMTLDDVVAEVMRHLSLSGLASSRA